MTAHRWESVGPVDCCTRCRAVVVSYVGSPLYGQYSAPIDPDDEEAGVHDWQLDDPGCKEET